MDSRCHKLTASFVRRSHQRDKNVPICLFFEVHIKLQRSFHSVAVCVCMCGGYMLARFTIYVLFRSLMKRVGKRQYHQEYTTWYVEVHVLDVVTEYIGHHKPLVPILLFASTPICQDDHKRISEMFSLIVENTLSFSFYPHSISPPASSHVEASAQIWGNSKLQYCTDSCTCPCMTFVYSTFCSG